MTVVAFVAAAIAGTLLRIVATGRDASFNRRLMGTIAVNVGGSFLLGWLQATDAATVTALGVGGLGALTTFSTFIAQVECIAREGRRRDAMAYVGATLLLGLLAAAVGHALA